MFQHFFFKVRSIATDAGVQAYVFILLFWSERKSRKLDNINKNEE